MIYEIENLNSKIEDGNFYLTFNNNLNKNERFFLNLLIQVYSKSDNLKIFLSEDIFKKQFKISAENIQAFLERLSKKSVTYNISIQEKRCIGTLNLISSFFISNDSITIFLPQELKESKKNKTLFSLLNLKTIYNFKDKNTFIFYSYFFKNFILKKPFDIEFEELKKILKLEEKYDRFFDFEKNVIKNIIADLENLFSLKCEKIKIGHNINNKVIGFKFFFGEYIWEEDENLKLKSVLFIIKNDIVDAAEVYSTLKEGIHNYGYDTIYKTCFRVKQNWKSSNMNFDDYLKFTISNLNNRDNEPKVFIQKVFSSSKELRKVFINEMEKIKPNTLLDSTFFSNEFLTSIYNLKEDKILNFQNDLVSIIINWKKEKESTIKIYLL
jgi:hypothetical protein